MSVKIGINPITWTNDDVPELGGDTPARDLPGGNARRRAISAPSSAASFPRQRRRPRRRPRRATTCSWSRAGGTDACWSATSTPSSMPSCPISTLLRDVGAGVVVYADTSRRPP